MNANDYQQEATRFLPGGASLHQQLVQGVLGLASEAGECAGVLEKYVGQGRLLDREKMIEEAGDCLWFLAEICTALGVRLADVMEANLRKLGVRYADGHTPEASIARVDVGEHGHAP